MGIKPLEVKVTEVTTRLDAILHLLGGTPEEREKALEVLYGITRPAVVSIVATQLEAAAQSLESVNKTIKALKANAKELGAP